MEGKRLTVILRALTHKSLEKPMERRVSREEVSGVKLLLPVVAVVAVVVGSSKGESKSVMAVVVDQNKQRKVDYKEKLPQN